MVRSLQLIILLSITTWVSAQKSNRDTIGAFPVTEKIKLDGILDELAWKQATIVTNFTQTDPNLGEPGTEKTKVAVLYSATALYIGVWCYQSSSTKIFAKSLQRDFDFDGEDNFRVAISPFNDGRRGYEFVINPNGARADLLVSASDDASSDWNGVWDAAVTGNKEGWFAEIEIPYNTLKFKKSAQQKWAINFERSIKGKNETDRWQGCSRDYSIENFAVAGDLTCINGVCYSQRFELKPYLLGGLTLNDDSISYSPIAKIGFDLNCNITSTLKLNITANTDFAQVESDVIQVNLSRFNLYYPEKREFFLEGANNFDFYIGNSNNVFYSRRIGIENFQTVNILGGARLFGKAGKSNIGFLSEQTAATDSIPSVNNSVFRYKYDLGEQSYIGGILTSKISSRDQNIVAGLDGNFSTSRFLKNKNLVIGAAVSLNLDSGKVQDNSLAYRIFSDYPNDLVDHFIALSSVLQNFDPELGFLTRSNFDALTWHLVIEPRWFTKYGIKKVLFKPWDFTVYRTQSSGELESFTNETRLLGFIFRSGDACEFNLQQAFDRIDTPFDLTHEIMIDTGKYRMNNYEVQFNSYRGRKIWTELLCNWGTFYGGRITTYSVLAGININKHLNFTEQYDLNVIAQSDLTNNIQQAISTINYAFTTRFDLALLVQYNSEEDQLLSNFRVHWIPKIGTDLYFVWNNGYSPVKQLDRLKPTVNNGAAKLVWRFTF
jgi:hypothetical protein